MCSSLPSETSPEWPFNVHISSVHFKTLPASCPSPSSKAASTFLGISYSNTPLLSTQISLSLGSLEKQNKYIKRFIIRHWLTQLWRLTSLKIYSQQTGDPGKPIESKSKGRRRLMFQLKGSHAERKNSFLLSLFILFRLSVDWMRPFTLGRAICFTQPTDANVKLIQKHPHRHAPKLCLTKYLGTPWSGHIDT